MKMKTIKGANYQGWPNAATYHVVCAIAALQFVTICTTDVTADDAREFVRLMWPDGVPGCAGDWSYKDDDVANVVLCTGHGDINFEHVAAWIDGRLPYQSINNITLCRKRLVAPGAAHGGQDG